MNPKLIAAFRWACATFALILLPAADYWRLVRKAREQKSKIADLEKAAQGYSAFITLLIGQRDEARKALKTYEVHVQLDLHDLCAERDEALDALRVLVAATQHGAFCLACGCHAASCPPVCARFVAAGIAAPTSNAVAEA